MTVPAEARHVGWRFDVAKTIFHRVCFAKIERLGIPPMAIVAADALLPMHVVRQGVGGHVQMPRLVVPYVGVAMAGHAVVFLGRLAVLAQHVAAAQRTSSRTRGIAFMGPLFPGGMGQSVRPWRPL